MRHGRITGISFLTEKQKRVCLSEVEIIEFSFRKANSTCYEIDKMFVFRMYVDCVRRLSDICRREIGGVNLGIQYGQD